MRINIQPIEKFSDPDNGATLRVHGIFPTIQGEGPLTGHPAIFTRLAGCNLQCPHCDTEYTGPEAHSDGEPGVRRLMVSDIVKRIRELHPGPRLVVITGGEPFRQNIAPLCQALLDEDYQVQVETNGTLPVSFGLPADVWVVCSPKAGKVHPSIAEVAIAWKYVLTHDSVSEVDGLPLRALDHTAPARGVARPPENLIRGAIYLQPADLQDAEINQKNLQAVIRSCMQHGYTLQLQTHKLINME